VLTGLADRATLVLAIHQFRACPENANISYDEVKLVQFVQHLVLDTAQGTHIRFRRETNSEQRQVLARAIFQTIRTHGALPSSTLIAP
jgi:hypothetical protein